MVIYYILRADYLAHVMERLKARTESWQALEVGKEGGREGGREGVYCFACALHAHVPRLLFLSRIFQERAGLFCSCSCVCECVRVETSTRRNRPGHLQGSRLFVRKLPFALAAFLEKNRPPLGERAQIFTLR